MAVGFLCTTRHGSEYSMDESRVDLWLTFVQWLEYPISASDAHREGSQWERLTFVGSISFPPAREALLVDVECVSDWGLISPPFVATVPSPGGGRLIGPGGLVV